MFDKAKLLTEAKPRNEDQAELDQLRADRNARENADRAAAEKKRLEEYAKREWVNEGAGTNVQSLVIEGGKLWRIYDRIYFMPVHATVQYNTGLGGLHAQAANAYGAGVYSTTSYGNLTPLF